MGIPSFASLIKREGVTFEEKESVTGSKKKSSGGKRKKGSWSPEFFRCTLQRSQKGGKKEGGGTKGDSQCNSKKKGSTRQRREKSVRISESPLKDGHRRKGKMAKIMKKRFGKGEGGRGSAVSDFDLRISGGEGQSKES